jgi:hypothetical protein
MFDEKSMLIMWSSRKFANIGETPPHSQLLEQRILIYDMDSCQFVEHTASFDPCLSDSTPADSITIARVDYR